MSGAIEGGSSRIWVTNGIGRTKYLPVSPRSCAALRNSRAPGVSARNDDHSSLLPFVLALCGRSNGEFSAGRGVARGEAASGSGALTTPVPGALDRRRGSGRTGFPGHLWWGGKQEVHSGTNGCGCAFIDYDNDGWMDIFLLSGTRLEGDPPEATNRLYKNNRDGTFTDVTEKAGLKAAGWACGVCVADYNNDGFDDIFCTYFGQNRLYRNNGDGTFTDVTRKAGLWKEEPPSGVPAVLFSTTTAMAISICSSPTTSASRFGARPGSRRKPELQLERRSRRTAARADCPPARHSCTTTTAMAPSPTSPAGGDRHRDAKLRHDGGRRRPRRRRLDRHFRRLRFHAQPVVHEQS